MSAQQHRWSTDDARDSLLRTEQTLVRKVNSAWSGFIDFALRDNVLEVAVGLIIASAFTAVVNSLVSDVILPPLSLLPFMARNLEEKFLVLRKGPHYKHPIGYNTRQQAADDGAVVWTYGVFLDHVLNFLGLGLTLYAIATLYGYLSNDSIIRHMRRCPYCRKEISVKAKRCALCTSWLDGREDKDTSGSALAMPVERAEA